jgi:putative heme-binding domain-containing protein
MFLRKWKRYGLAILAAGLGVLLTGWRLESRGEARAAASQDVKAHRAALRDFVMKNPASGSVEEGRKLFFDRERLSCLQCHQVNGKGGKSGPDLSGVGARASLAYLVDSVLDPSKDIVPGYQRATVVLADGRTLNGVLKAQTEEWVELKVGSKLLRLEKDEVADVQLNPVSPMPDGLADDLSPVEFADLIAYLRSLKGSQLVAVAR